MSVLTRSAEASVRTRIRAVVVADLDGTLAFGNRPPGPAVSALVRSLGERPDIRLVLATSRPPPAVRRLMGVLADRADLVCCNGALRITVDGAVGRTGLPNDVVRALLAELLVARGEFCLDYGHWFLASGQAALPWMGAAERSVLTRGLPSDGVLKVSVAAGSARLGVRLAAAAGPAELIRHEERGDTEIVARDVNKATGLTHILGAERPPVIAIGNDTNDLDLLTGADRGIVVGEGLRQVDGLRYVERIAASDSAVATGLGKAIRQVVD